jgi:hypothetical protein
MDRRQEDAVPEPSGRPWSRSTPSTDKSAAAQLTELKSLVVGYARQETVDPLKTLGRYLGFGLAGSLSLGLGLSLLILALLRGLQQVSALQDPTWTWVPHLSAATAGLVLVAVFLWRLMRFMNSSNKGASR